MNFRLDPDLAEQLAAMATYVGDNSKIVTGGKTEIVETMVSVAAALTPDELVMLLEFVHAKGPAGPAAVAQMIRSNRITMQRAIGQR